MSKRHKNVLVVYEYDIDRSHAVV